MNDSPPVGFVDFVVARGFALHRTAVLLTRQEQSAEDLVQIALAKAWRSWSRIDGNHEAYVRAIMVNEFASAWRRRWRGEVPTADLPEQPLKDQDDLGDDVSTRQAVMAALATLPPRQRAVVVLRFFHDYTEAATAEAMGTSVGTVKSQTSKALASLRVSPKLREETPPRLIVTEQEGMLR
jgi:RNA polymerase sigma-70 factor (sigma-E family)